MKAGEENNYWIKENPLIWVDLFLVDLSVQFRTFLENYWVFLFKKKWKKIKLIWQFSGADALKIADHYLVHLDEYISREEFGVIDKGIKLINEFSSISYIIVDKSIVEKLRIALKPHKGLIVE